MTLTLGATQKVVNVEAATAQMNYDSNRDYNMAAYPALRRSAQNPNPFFERKNPGFYFSGPIKRDKVSFFFNYEDTNQVQAITFQPDLASLQPLAANYDSPARCQYIKARFDWHISDKHSAFLQYTHDGNFAFSPETGSPSVPSAWVNLNNWSDRWAMGITSTLTPTIVNDFRVGWRCWDNKENRLRAIGSRRSHDKLRSPDLCFWEVNVARLSVVSVEGRARSRWSHDFLSNPEYPCTI
jgi:hypothetical protein